MRYLRLIAVPTLVAALGIVGVAVFLHLSGGASADWTEFSIGPASGRSVSARRTVMPSDRTEPGWTRWST